MADRESGRYGVVVLRGGGGEGGGEDGEEEMSRLRVVPSVLRKWGGNAVVLQAGRDTEEVEEAEGPKRKRRDTEEGWEWRRAEAVAADLESDGLDIVTGYMELCVQLKNLLQGCAAGSYIDVVWCAKTFDAAEKNWGDEAVCAFGVLSEIRRLFGDRAAIHLVAVGGKKSEKGGVEELAALVQGSYHFSSREEPLPPVAGRLLWRGSMVFQGCSTNGSQDASCIRGAQLTTPEGSESTSSSSTLVGAGRKLNVLKVIYLNAIPRHYLGSSYILDFATQPRAQPDLASQQNSIVVGAPCATDQKGAILMAALSLDLVGKDKKVALIAQMESSGHLFVIALDVGGHLSATRLLSSELRQSLGTLLRQVNDDYLASHGDDGHSRIEQQASPSTGKVLTGDRMIRMVHNSVSLRCRRGDDAGPSPRYALLEGGRDIPDAGTQQGHRDVLKWCSIQGHKQSTDRWLHADPIESTLSTLKARIAPNAVVGDSFFVDNQKTWEEWEPFKILQTVCALYGAPPPLEGPGGNEHVEGDLTIKRSKKRARKPLPDVRGLDKRRITNKSDPRQELVLKERTLARNAKSISEDGFDTNSSPSGRRTRGNPRRLRYG